ncbi:MAG: hypothetical protein KJ899_12715 [Gammaproteobacteria bacterium]|nr:hypothetical protein [Gammaproteobacteria bacterium]
MKYMLLLLSVFITTSVWAGDLAVAPAAMKADVMKTAPAVATGAIIEFKGTKEDVGTLLDELEKTALYKENACFHSSEKRTTETTQITCASASGALMDYLLKNAQDKVTWHISPAPMLKACPAGCYLMPCPITTKCCRLTTHQPC